MKKSITFGLIIVLMFMSTTQLAPVIAQDHTEGTNQCHTPTKTITVIASNANNDFIFDKDEYKVDRNTCYTLIFQNAAPAEHDVTIDEDGEDFHGAHLHLASNTDNGGSTNMTIMTPDKDVTYDLYCSVIGHRAAGMEADFVVGAGSSKDESPGFTIFFAFAALLVPVLILRKRK